ncbi:hypothetical protein B0H11DRAFT_1998410 [Mycena galericulata]|nr:hypothetical protein B0H11DRAFT_1998410 [Mycena galericulata]
MMVLLKPLMVLPWMGGISGLRLYLQVSKRPAWCLACTSSTFVWNSPPELHASKLWGISVSIYMRWGIHCSTHYRDTSHSRWAPSDDVEYLYPCPHLLSLLC